MCSGILIGEGLDGFESFRLRSDSKQDDNVGLGSGLSERREDRSLSSFLMIESSKMLLKAWKRSDFNFFDRMDSNSFAKYLYFTTFSSTNENLDILFSRCNYGISGT